MLVARVDLVYWRRKYTNVANTKWPEQFELISRKNGVIIDWSKKASLRPSAAALVWKFPILALYMFVSTVIVYVTVPVSTLEIKVARTAILVRTGTHIQWSERRENKKKAKEAPHWKARDRKKAAQEPEKTIYMNNQAMNNKTKNQCKTNKKN